MRVTREHNTRVREKAKPHLVALSSLIILLGIGAFLVAQWYGQRAVSRVGG